MTLIERLFTPKTDLVCLLISKHHQWLAQYILFPILLTSSFVIGYEKVDHEYILSALLIGWNMDESIHWSITTININQK